MSSDSEPEPKTYEAALIDAARAVFDVAGFPVVRGISTEAAAHELLVLLDRMIARSAELPRVTQKEADRVAAALERLKHEVNRLQMKSNPPPPLPIAATSRGGKMTIWEHWLAPYRFDGHGGRPREHDWHIIAGLLAIYETVFDRKAAATMPSHDGSAPHPTMRFLQAAFDLANKIGTERAGENLNLAAPPAEALRSRIKELRASGIEERKKSLRAVLDRKF